MRREPPIIDAKAQDVRAAGDAPAADAAAPEPSQPETVVASEPDVAPAAQAAAAPPRKRRRGVFRYVLGALVALGAVGVAWLVTPEDYGPGGLRTQIVAMLPPEAQRAVETAQTAFSPKPDGAARAAKPSDSKPSDSKPADTKPADARPADAKPVEALKPFGALPDVKPPVRAPTTVAEAPKPAASPNAAPKPPEPAVAPAQDKPVASPTPSPSSVQAPPPPAPSPAQPAASSSAASPVAAPTAVASPADTAKLDALVARIDALQAKLDQAKPDAAPAQGADDAAARLEALTARLAALEAKLDQPKTDARAPQARENATAAATDPGAARAVVAQALMQAFGAGAPLEPSIAALRNLGVGDDKLADLAPYATSGAPGAAQLAAQWVGLRAKIVALDAAPVGDAWTDKWMAKAKSLVKVQPMGAQSGSSAAAVYSRVEAALQRGDLAEAAKASDALPDAGKTIAADWRAAAQRRLKAEAAARALLTESIAALGRSKS